MFLPRRNVLSLILAASLAACASGGPPGSRYNVDGPPIALAGFQLQGIRIVWQDNPGFNVGFNYMVPRGSGYTQPPENIKNRAHDHLKTILEHFRNEAVPTLTKELIAHKVPPSGTHRVVLFPVSGYQDTAGWGTHLTVRVTVLDDTNKAVWTSDIESHSGLQWFGPALSSPDASYVRNFAAGLMKTMLKAGLVSST